MTKDTLSSKRQPEIRDFWRNYHRTAISLTLLMQLIATTIIISSLVFVGMPVGSGIFWITLLATLATTTTLNFAIVSFLLTPLRDLSMAVTARAGQKPTDIMANPNIRRYARNGFRPLLQFIYDESSNQTAVQPTEVAAETALINTALSQTSAGLIIMSADGQVLYTNHAAPVIETTDGSRQLELVFENEQSITEWLAEVQTESIRATKLWRRVPNKLVGQEDRRVFSISANYEKGSSAEVVIVTYDASAIFSPNDDGLDFLSFAAHELRGPITVIRGYLDVLKRELATSISPEQDELFDRLIVSANRITGYVNNILNTNKYDRRHLRVNLAECQVSDIFKMISDDMNLRANSQRRQIINQIPANLPTVAADKSSISEVMSNLIDNAIKYSDEGGQVVISAAADGDHVRISVTDSGIGIPSNIIGNIFDKFYRSHRSRETVAGTGIGLYLARAIIESHGGKIDVSSIEGKGSTFSFTLPVFASVESKIHSDDFVSTDLINHDDTSIQNHSKFTS